MFDDSRSFLTRAFLRAEYALDFKGYTAAEDAVLLARLTAWNERMRLSETQAEGAFTQTFFVETWGYGEAGRVASDQQTLIPKLSIAGEGAGGGQGEADLALGWFRGRRDAVPQVLCEFKDISSKLDAKQNRKGNTRTPVEQCLNYVRGARRRLYGNEPVQPWWALVTDMNEFRLYWWDRAPTEFMRFLIARPLDLYSGPYDLLTGPDQPFAAEAKFDRFLFSRLFARDTLLSEAGRPPLLRLVERQGRPQRKLEGDFYARYKAVRERLFNVVTLNNSAFPGSPTELLRLCQKLLDRFIFVFYCEDMGQRMLFPPDLIRDRMKSRSAERTYEESGDELWTYFRTLFGRLNDGRRWGQITVPAVNGGLFAPDPLIDGLSIPNHVFAKAGQGANDGTLSSDPDTLLYLCARYNYAGGGDVKESLSLYTLGRIFEQSIIELEYKVGELEGRETVAALSKRKRDGVYYTPEKVVNYLVEETLGPWFSDAKAACGYPAPEDGAPNLAVATAYADRLAAIRIVDPACGSGAFLISAFRRLLVERLAAAQDVERARGRDGAIDERPLIAAILRDNLYGVDINPASVEIAKLALWLHSMRAEAPLSSLAHTLRTGNSLVGPDFWTGRVRTGADEDRVRPFDWREAFPEVWPENPEEGREGGFDIVLGNPPYVKLQNLIKVDPDVAAYLGRSRGPDTYGSARTGNFDLYLPFVEKGLRLLGPGGRMAYIAPSLWAVNEYGEGLRTVILRTRQLDRWIDFKAHQVFDEAITYTALQFFTQAPNDVLRIAAAPDGQTQDLDWSGPDLAVPYGALPGAGEWLMATGAERALIDRLARDCLRLDDPSLTTGIMVGIQTSADAIYHLERRGTDRYVCTPAAPDKRPGEKKRPPAPPPYDVQIEDAIMKPLVSGREAKRYEDPETATYLLFPYERDARGVMRLIPADAMAKRFPKAWAHLLKWEKPLRGRESDKMNRDADWWGYVYPKNLDKHERPKLIVAQTVPGMRVCADEKADKYLNNVRVNGILPAKAGDRGYLLGALNGPVADFVFRRISKPKQGGWFEANKQFIAPLPIPEASPTQRRAVAERARALQAAWTRRRELLDEAAERLATLSRTRRDARWLWPDLPDLPAAIERAPRGIRLPTERRTWAEGWLDGEEASRVAALQAALDRGGVRSARYEAEELRLVVDGETILGRIFLSPTEGELAEAYWRWLLLSANPRDAERFAADLRRPPAASEAPAAGQFVARVNELAALVASIATAERDMNELLYGLYRLTPDERKLVENERGRRDGTAPAPPIG